MTDGYHYKTDELPAQRRRIYPLRSLVEQVLGIAQILKNPTQEFLWRLAKKSNHSGLNKLRARNKNLFPIVD